jgi:hypothetical protein
MKRMNFFSLLPLLAVAALMFTACGSDDDDAGNTPNAYVDSRITNVVPEQYLNQIRNHMKINDGLTPPNIEGIYLMHVSTLVFDSYNAKGIDTFNDAYFRFYDQNTVNKTVKLLESGGTDGTGTGAYISGEGNNFTVFLNMSGSSHGFTFKEAVIISGTMTSEGIRNMEYCLLMIDNNDYEEKYIMKPGRFRIIKDGDGMSENATWPVE